LLWSKGLSPSLLLYSLLSCFRDFCFDLFSAASCSDLTLVLLSASLLLRPRAAAPTVTPLLLLVSLDRTIALLGLDFSADRID
jgi:hypothetical protein